MRWRRAVLISMATAAVLIGAPIPPAAAAEAPTIAPSTLDAQRDDIITVDASGCEGTPKILVDVDLFEPSEGELRSPPPTGPGSASMSYTLSGGDVAFTTVCPSGARSATAIVDVETPILGFDPWRGPEAPDYQLHASIGTDCPEPTAAVQYRVGDWIQVVRAPTDERGDFRAPAPAVGPDQLLYVRAWCTGVNYIPVVHWTGAGPPPTPAERVLEVDAGGGAPGSTLVGRYPCYEPPVTSAHDVEGDVPVEVTWIASPPRYEVRATARQDDLTLTVRCGRAEESIRYDVERPTMAVARAGDGAIVSGTDCPVGSEVSVAFASDGGTSAATATIDLWGDWSVDVPDAQLDGPTTVTARCGAVGYGPVVLVADAAAPLGTTTPATPEPAVPISGSAGYTG
ncbi:MAG: hypothetical protein R2702_19095 [Acidimicrobiales bacterium]